MGALPNDAVWRCQYADIVGFSGYDDARLWIGGRDAKIQVPWIPRGQVLRPGENHFTIQMFSMVVLTKPQRLLVEYLEERGDKGDPPPTYREICAHLGYASPKAAADLVAALEKKGVVACDKGRSRGIRLVQRSTGVPMLGQIPAGVPSETSTEAEECLDLNPGFCGIRDRSRAFALRVTGDSMIGRRIFDGDIVLLEHAAVPRNGDVVAALIDNESTLKTFVRKHGKAWLHAENPRYPDLLPALDMQIQGVARAVIRMLTR